MLFYDEKKAEEVAEKTAKETADKEIGKSKQEMRELEQRKKETKNLIKKDPKTVEEFVKGNEN